MKNRNRLLALLLVSLTSPCEGFRDPHIQTRRRLLGGSLAAKFKNLEEVLATSHQGGPLMVVFTAVNCGPCRLMKKELKRVSDTIGPGLKVFAVDTEQYPHVGTRFQVSSLPCLLLVHNGEPVLRLEGVRKAEEVVRQIQTITLQ